MPKRGSKHETAPDLFGGAGPIEIPGPKRSETTNDRTAREPRTSPKPAQTGGVGANTPAAVGAEFTVSLSDIRPPSDRYYLYDRSGVERLMADIAANGLKDAIDVFEISDDRYRFGIGDGDARYLACTDLAHTTIRVRVQPGAELEAKLRRLQKPPLRVRGNKTSTWRDILTFHDVVELLRVRLGGAEEPTRPAIVRESGLDKGTVSHFIHQFEAVQRAGFALTDLRLYRVTRTDFRRLKDADVADVHRIVEAAQQPRLTGKARREDLEHRFGSRVQITVIDGRRRLSADIDGLSIDDRDDFQRYLSVLLREE